jgi:phospholipid/cholesterol/gamma-HCH transport system substrate-binding protein
VFFLESKSNYTIIGLAVLILATGLLSAGLWLSVGFDRKQYDNYIVYMHEPVSGLSDESPVKYNGVRIGYVSTIELSPADPQKVKLLLKIETGMPVTDSTQATLISQGITGTTYLGLTATSASLVPIKKTASEPYPVIPYKPSFYYLLEKNINRLSDQVNSVFTPENTKNIGESLAHIESITKVFSQNNQYINKTIRDIPMLVNALETSARKFNIMANDVSIAGKQFTNTMKAGKNSIDQISQQTVPAAVTLLRRLDTIAANLEIVSNQLRQNPSIIIRGSHAPKLGPGE